MHILALSALALLGASQQVQVQALRHDIHQLRDLYAYPKYEVQFLNDLPLSKSDAERFTSFGLGDVDDWLRARAGGGRGGGSDGGVGSNGFGVSTEGQAEGKRKSLGDGSGSSTEAGAEQRAGHNHLKLVPMNFAHPDEPHGPPYPYLCLMPSPNTTSHQLRMLDQMEDEIVEDHNNGSELDPSEGWAALGHLEGKCLYSKQGWFTYAYCHNSHIRQFRQAPHKHPHPPEGIVPTEDREYDAYTLGQVSPGALQRFTSTSSSGGDGGGNGQNDKSKPASLHKAQQANLPRVNGKANAGPRAGVGSDGGRDTSLSRNGGGDVSPTPAISFGHGASNRYLVQRWSHGTRCDKTGRPREVEVQIHCSMTTGDMIYMIKELSICQYVVIIHSPYLCGLPGFKARDLGAIQPAGIQCRQVVEDGEFDEWEKENEQKLKQKQNQLALDQAQAESDGGTRVDDTEKSIIEQKDKSIWNLGLPFGKRPTGADNNLASLFGLGSSGDTPSQQQQKQQQQQHQHFGLKGPEKMFGESEGDADRAALLMGQDGHHDHGQTKTETEGVDVDDGITFEDVQILSSGEQVAESQLREMLKKALSSLSDRTQTEHHGAAGGGGPAGNEDEENNGNGDGDAANGDGDGEEKVIFYTWEEDEDGTPILVDADDGEGSEDESGQTSEARGPRANDKDKNKDKHLLRKAISDFLGQKGKAKSKSKNKNKNEGSNSRRDTEDGNAIEEGNASDRGQKRGDRGSKDEL
ncbi:hypothetical protein I316_04571 [Kwoniella heveanensis BCC8398]|uniref:Protein OS-9 homolog n=1 Tax=Kwoniella heveanensis BCC8398 TaxID=1296120 RepID=A0A1B9GS07_9TREE|nr:hypothetical protein I316_04571 [Kwoniella heveanensis BCC8398]